MKRRGWKGGRLQNWTAAARLSFTVDTATPPSRGRTARSAASTTRWRWRPVRHSGTAMARRSQSGESPASSWR